MPSTSDRPTALLPKPWSLAPGIDDATTAARAEAAKQWEQHKNRVASFIPHVIHLRHEKAEREREEKEREERAKRNKRPKGKAKQAGKGPGLKRAREDDEAYEADDDEVRLTKKLKKPEHDGRANGTRPIAFKKRKANGKAVALPPEELSDMDVDEDAWPPKPSTNCRKQRSLLKKTEHDHRANGTRPVALKNRKAKGKAVASGTEELSDTDVDDDARRPERSNNRQRFDFVQMPPRPPHLRATARREQRVLSGSNDAQGTRYSLRSLTYLSADDSCGMESERGGVWPNTMKCGLPRLPEPSHESRSYSTETEPEDDELQSQEEERT
ncbi:hypothetical protein OH76DRAFT_1491104 [Lentinus brumalis]|uniref:Uncharacterized protein n=1 Tax=Lentinus brumalis TaxID=2498619 RepID=A0A371CGS3_9APHY|nr:hypothetical protein OH76DRAFT_1491104 [Polyporus brumalis]